MSRRYQGRITEWRDDRGFGFVTPMEGGDTGGGTVFVHIKSFASRARRPVDNELVTYALREDPKGRVQGVDVRFAGERAKSPKPEAMSAHEIDFDVHLEL